MDISEKMKYKLANGMKELLVHTPVDKITCLLYTSGVAKERFEDIERRRKAND